MIYLKNKKLIILAMLFVVGSGTHLLAQNTVVGVPEDEVGGIENHDYYFFKHGSFREDITNRKNKVITQIDSLELFVSDSIAFHKRNSYNHEKAPHGCQNRYYKFGFVGPEKEIIIPFEYDWIQPKYEKAMRAGKMGTMGVIDAKGHILIPFRRNGLYIHDNRLIALKPLQKDSLVKFYDIKGKYLFQVNGFDVKRLNENYLSVFAKGGRFIGVIDLRGDWIIAPGIYEYVRWISDKFICIFKNRKCGIIDLKQNVILPFEYENINPTDNGQFIVFKDRMCAVVNEKNKIVIPFDSVLIRNFGTLYGVGQYRSDIFALYNSKGEQLLPEKYNIGMPQDPGGNEFKKNPPKSAIIIRDPTTRLLGMYRADGLKLLPIENSMIKYDPVYHAIIIQRKVIGQPDKNMYSAIDMDGKIIVPFSSNTLSLVQRSPALLLTTNDTNKSAFINAKTGQIFTDYVFEYKSYDFILADGFVAAKKNWLYALISPDGKMLTDATYSGFYPVTKENRLLFAEEIVCLGTKNNKSFGITKTGKEIPQISK
jgi:hypothetical protein